MTRAWPFGPTYGTLPSMLPIFPLRGVMLLPGGRLPLNIFEPRYLAMLDDAMRGGRMIGMIQPTSEAQGRGEPLAIFSTGCAGRIISFEETDDGRYEVTLTGMCRFHVIEELSPHHGYRRVMPDWSAFRADIEPFRGAPSATAAFDRQHFNALLQSYFRKQGLSADWAAIEEAPDHHLLTCLAMICPFSPCEKQALLEAATERDLAEVMTKLLAIAVAEGEEPPGAVRH